MHFTQLNSYVSSGNGYDALKLTEKDFIVEVTVKISIQS